MKNTSHNKVELVTAGRKKYVHQFEFSKKNAIIRSIEIIGACAIALLVGAGIYGLL